jgi:transposase
MDEYFPEFRGVVKNVNRKTAIGLLSEAPFPGEIIRLGKKRFYRKLKRWSKNRFGKKKSLKLWEAAKRSIGVKVSQESTKIELRQLVEELALVKRHREELVKGIEEKTKETEEGKILIKLPGIGYLGIGKLIGETGRIKNYSGAESLEKLAGLNLIELSSGKKESGKRISKRGRKLMRTIIYQMTLASIRNSKAVKYEYQYRLNVKKQKKMKALTATACKLLRVIYGLVSENREYDERKVSRHYYENKIRKREKYICEWVTPQ